MNRNPCLLVSALAALGWIGHFSAVSGCAAESPAPYTGSGTGGSNGDGTGARSATGASTSTGGGTSSSSTTTGTGASTGTGGGMAMTGGSSAVVATTGTGGITSTGAGGTIATGGMTTATGGTTTTPAATGGAPAATAGAPAATAGAPAAGGTTGAAGSAAVGVCVGSISNNSTACTADCTDNPCGIQKLGLRDCTCQADLTYSCESCDYSANMDNPIVAAPTTAMTDCESADDVMEDRTDCGTDVENGTRCQSLDAENRMCACWESVWDCGSQPNFW